MRWTGKARSLPATGSVGQGGASNNRFMQKSSRLAPAIWHNGEVLTTCRRVMETRRKCTHAAVRNVQAHPEIVQPGNRNVRLSAGQVRSGLSLHHHRAVQDTAAAEG